MDSIAFQQAEVNISYLILPVVKLMSKPASEEAS